MAKITIAGDAIVITSSKKLDDIKELQKYSPKALSLFETDDNGKKCEVFRVGASDHSSINQYGIMFAAESREGEKLACLTAAIPAGVTDAKAFAADTFGNAVVMLNKVEANFDAALAEVAANKAAILENITVL